jgi:hypothetical protein
MKARLFTYLRNLIILFSVLFVSSISTATLSYSQTNDLFTDLRGNWRGGGTVTFDDGEKRRMVCDAAYSGTAVQLRLIINCKSNSNKIQMNAKLSANSGKLLGTWEEKTYNAIGTISGVASENKIKFYIGGNVLGTMNVKYSKRRQDVTIKTTGAALRDVKIKLTRR